MSTISKQKTSALKIFQSILLGLLLISAHVNAEVSSLDLPNLGNSTGIIFSPEYERRLGQAFLNQIRHQAHIITDPEIETYINSIGYRLVSHSDNNTQKFTFFVVNDPSINAFSAPGGIVGVNSGTVLVSSTESELAGVMAHEIAHITQKHMARAMEEQARMSIPRMAAMIGSIILASQNPDAGQAAMVATQGIAAQSQINFTRANEQEADRIGMQLLARANFNPMGMPDFFEKLLNDSRYQGQAPEFLRSHPLTSRRIADTRARAETYPPNPNIHESKNYKFVKAKLRVLLAKDPDDAHKYFQQKLTTEGHGDNFANYTYGDALALTKMGDYNQAHKELKRLLTSDPENTFYILAMAQLDVSKSDYADAFKIFDNAVNLFPDYRPAVYYYAQALLQDNKPAKAAEILHEYGKYYEPDLTYYEYLTRAEGEAGHKIEAGIASAEYYYLTGETGVAIDQIRHLLRSRDPRPDYYQTERLQDRMVYMERELKIEKDMKIKE